MVVNETIVREFFELHGFLVRQQRKFVAPNAHDEEEIDFVVLNPHAAPVPDEPLPFVLSSTALARVESAVVAVRGWHSETFSPRRLAHSPELFRFAEEAVFAPAARALGGTRCPLKILVVPALPQAEALRSQSIELLRRHGVDAVIPFPTALADLVAHVETNRNYQKSELLQTLRVLKNYGFLREPQLELFRPRRRSRGVPPPASP
jgi:hypothetical protein